MAQGDDDDRHDSRESTGLFHPDDLEDSTMEISLHDIYALSRGDQQSPKPERASSSQDMLSHMTPPPAPNPQADVYESQTVEIDEELIDLDDILEELTSEAYDEHDYDLVQKNFEEIDLLVDPTLFHAEPGERQAQSLVNTGVLEQSYEDLLASALSLEEDTDPSDNLYLPDLSDSISLGHGNPSEAFSSMEELSEQQFSEDVEEPEDSWVDSTSVFSPDSVLLDEARGAFQPHISQSTEHMIEVPILALVDEYDQVIEQDSTGMFEVPDELLSQLRQWSSQDASSPNPDDLDQTMTSAIAPFELEARLNDQGHLVLTRGQPMAIHLKPGMRLRLLVQILHD